MADSASCQDARQVAVVSIKRNAAQARNRRRGKARTRSGLELLSALVHEERRDRTLGAPGRDYHSQKPRVMRVPRGAGVRGTPFIHLMYVVERRPPSILG